MELLMASYIDHTLLAPGATRTDIEVLCEQAIEHGFASVCVNPYRVKLCVEMLTGASPGVCSVVGFPLGAVPPETKKREASRVLEDGADELDMVMNLGGFKDGDESLVKSDIEAVVEEADSAVVKVIIETGLWSAGEIRRACRWSVEAGADFVKTSTGFGPGGATVQDVALMHRTVEGSARVKASGGIHTYDQARALIDAGADRIGASQSVAIVQGE